MRLRDLLKRITALEEGGGGGGSGEVFTAVYTFDGLDEEGVVADSSGPLEVDGNELVAVADCIVQGSVYPQPYGITGEGSYAFSLETDADIAGGGAASIPSTGPIVPLPFTIRLLAGDRFHYTVGVSEGDVEANGVTVQIVGVVL